MSRPVGDTAEIAKVGTISANGEEAIGQQIADAMAKVGNEGVITVEENKGLETETEVVEGMQFDRGYLSPYFVTDPAKMTANLEDCVILLHEKKLTSLAPMVPLLEAVMQADKQLLVIAEDIDGEALATLVVNKLRGGLEGRWRQSTRFRGSSQGDAARPCRSYRRHSDLRGAWASSWRSVTMDMLG